MNKRKGDSAETGSGGNEAHPVGSREMRILDANSEWLGVPAIELMERAGRGIADEANRLGDSFVVICGPGNNGGDGFAASRYLSSRPKIFFLSTPKTPEAYENFLRAKNYKPVPLRKGSLGRLREAISQSDVIIDAVFGTGFRGRLREPVKSIISLINSSGKKLLSVDVPSGLDPDTGKISGIAVKADVTVSLHAAKPGLLAKRRQCGRIKIVDIGIPPDAYTHIGKGDFKFRYPFRGEHVHKGDAGKLLVIGGSAEYTGAPYFAAMAGLKAGCDLAYVAAAQAPARRIAIMGPDLIVRPLSSEDRLSIADVPSVLSMDFDVLCIGNGLGGNSESLDAARQIISACRKPMVIDGDALKAVKPILPKLGRKVILTPHAGEFKALFSLPPNEKSLRRLSAKYKCAIVLKGGVDMVAQGERFRYNDSGTPYMSKGGSGDILAGLAAGFLAQGMEAFWAASLAALVNGLAGQIAFEAESVAMTASDILHSIGLAEAVLLE